MRIADDFFKREWSADLAQCYLHSEAYFKSEVHLEVVNRCFPRFDDPEVIKKVRKRFLGIPGDYHFLDDMGLWDDTNKRFYSPLLHKYLFQLCCKQGGDTEQKLLLDNTRDRLEQAHS